LSSYALRVQNIQIVKEAGDIAVSLLAHLRDSNGVPFLDSTGAIQNFTIRAPKTTFPGSGYLAYLTTLAQTAISAKYGTTITGTGAHGSNVITASASDVAKLFVGLGITGAGLVGSPTVSSILSTTTLQTSVSSVLSFTGNTASPSIVRTGTLTSGSNIVTAFSSTTDVTTGMTIDGVGIPLGTVVNTIISATQIIMSQNAQASGVGVSLTLSPVIAAINLTSVSPANLTSAYEGLTVKSTTSGVLATATTLSSVLSTSSAQLSQRALAASTGAVFNLSGTITYSISTSSLSVDYADLQRVVDIVNFNTL